MDTLDMLFAKIDKIQKLDGKENKQSIAVSNNVSSKGRNSWWRTSVIESSESELSIWRLTRLYDNLCNLKLRTKDNADSIKQS